MFVGRRVWNKNERVGRCSVVGVLAVGWLAFVSFGGVLVLRLSGAVLDGGAARRRGAGEAEAEASSKKAHEEGAIFFIQRDRLVWVGVC